MGPEQGVWHGVLKVHVCEPLRNGKPLRPLLLLPVTERFRCARVGPGSTTWPNWGKDLFLQFPGAGDGCLGWCEVVGRGGCSVNSSAHSFKLSSAAFYNLSCAADSRVCRLLRECGGRGQKAALAHLLIH